MHAGALDPSLLDDFAAGRDEVTAHRVKPMLTLEGSQLLLDGQSQARSVQQNSLVVPDPERDLLLDEQDRPVRDVTPGTIHLPVFHRIESGLEVGSTVTITAPDGFRRELTVAGFVRDSTMNTAIAGSKRLAVSAEDLAAVAAHTGTWEHLISFWVQDPATDLTTLRTAYQDAGLPAAGPLVDRSAFVLFTVFADGLLATVVLLAALLVLAVALLCVRLALRTALERDRREIAVMAALCIADRDIRSLYLLVHGMLAVAASLAGLFGGLLLEPRLSAGLTRYLGPVGGSEVVIAPVLVALLLVGVVLGGVETVLRRGRREGPLQVLRGAGTAAARPGRLRLHRSALPVGPALGLMSLLRRGGDAPLLVGVFALCAVLLILPTSVATTLGSPQFAAQLGPGGVDLRADLQHSGPASAEQFRTAQRALAEDPRVSGHTALAATRHRATASDGEELSLPVANGDHRSAQVTYADGRAPHEEGEIALSLLALAASGRSVGETLPLEVGGQWRELRIVGSYQDLTHGGITAKGRLPTAGEQVLRYELGVSLLSDSDPGVVAADLDAQLPGVRVVEVGEYRDQLLGPIAERTSSAAALAVGAGLVLAALLSAMMTRLSLAADAAPIAIQQALGAPAGTLRAPYLTRMLSTLVLGLVLGAVLALTLGERLFNLLLEGMFGGVENLFRGTSRIDLVVDPLTTGTALPLLLAVVVSLAVVLSCRDLRAPAVRTLTAD